MNDFIPRLEKLGPLGTGEGFDEQELKSKLEAVTKLIPYIKLVQSERLRVPERTEEAYEKFFSGKDFDRLFDELIADKFEVSQILMLLRQKARSPAEISEILGLTPSEVKRHFKTTARRGLIRFDKERNFFVAG
jgi:F420-non-reducing hydrogenase iron-sulfur subunit